MNDMSPTESNDLIQENGQNKLHVNDDTLILCKVCFSNRIDTIIMPCYHASICHECWKKMPVPKVCPICQGLVISTIDVIIDA